jgi:excisionase family DNA binding protein
MQHVLTETPQKRGLLSAVEVGEYLQLTEETVRRMARQGDIPSVKAGRRVRFNLTEVLAALGGGK